MKNEQPKNEKHLRDALLRVWYTIGKDVMKKLVDSPSNRLNGAIRTKDYPTRY